MRVPDEVAAMLRLHELGWGTRRIAAELGCDRETVQRYLAAGGWAPYRTPERPGALAGQGVWVTERFRRHRGNADVVRQELAGELGVTVSLRTVERACAPLRRKLAAEALATVRFETPPGRQLQIDFGERGVVTGEETVRAHLFVATLGYSRRVYVQAMRHERQSAWFEGLEGAFRHFGGLPVEVLLDNARALVEHHDAGTREVAFNERFHMLTWGARRLRAAAIAGLSTIPAVLTSEAQRGLAAQVIENQQRVANSNSEIAAVVARLTAKGMTNAAIAIALALALADPQSIRYYRVLADLPPEIAAWQDRAPVRVLYELVQAWRKEPSARASIRDALAAIPDDDDLPITAARRIVQQATGKSAGTFDKTPSNPEPATTRPARARSDVTETASAAEDVDADCVARVRAWLADPARSRPPLNV